MSYPPAEPTPALAYATPSAAGGSPVAAGVWIMIGGLALVFFGGCFCIGLLALTETTHASFAGPTPSPPLTWQQDLLMVALYAFAFACFAAGAYVMYLGLRKLLAVGR